MRVLLTNHGLAQAGGTEVYTRDLAAALAVRGHDIVVFSPVCGSFAESIRARGITVVDRLDADLASPDVIHGQHHVPAMAALARFPASPAVFVCHGFVPWEETPPAHPRIVRYVAVDEPCRERVQAAQLGRPIDVIPNFVDLTRFSSPRALPATPRRALVFSNSTDRSWTDPIAAACHARGIRLDIVGALAEHATDHPEDILPQYDIVFAKARSALEAIAAGCAVVTCDRAGVGSMVTAEAWAQLQRLNLGFRTLTQRHDPAVVGAEIDRYDPENAQHLTNTVRRHASLDTIAEQWVATYEQVSAAAPRALEADERLALARYLTWLGGSHPPGVKIHLEMSRLQTLLTTSRQEHEGAVRARDAAEQQIAAIYATRTWRAHDALLSWSGLAWLSAWVRRRK